MPRLPTCQEIVELVTEYLDGALDGVRHAQVAEHLAGCPECTLYLTQIQQTMKAAHGLSEDAGVVEDCEALVQAFRELDRDR